MKRKRREGKECEREVTGLAGKMKISNGRKGREIEIGVDIMKRRADQEKLELEGKGLERNIHVMNFCSEVGSKTGKGMKERRKEDGCGYVKGKT